METVKKTLAIELSDWMMDKRPGLLNTKDMQVNSEACHALASLLGCLMASVLAHGGIDAYNEALGMLVDKIDRNAAGTVMVAMEKQHTEPGLRTKQ